MFSYVEDTLKELVIELYKSSLNSDTIESRNIAKIFAPIKDLVNNASNIIQDNIYPQIQAAYNERKMKLQMG